MFEIVSIWNQNLRPLIWQKRVVWLFFYCCMHLCIYNVKSPFFLHFITPGNRLRIIRHPLHLFLCLFCYISFLLATIPGKKEIKYIFYILYCCCSVFFFIWWISFSILQRRQKELRWSVTFWIATPGSLCSTLVRNCNPSSSSLSQ